MFGNQLIQRLNSLKAGIERGHQVLHVGCGPGFYTIAASKTVGPEGHVFAVDVNRWAIQRVKEKVTVQGALEYWSVGVLDLPKIPTVWSSSAECDPDGFAVFRVKRSD